MSRQCSDNAKPSRDEGRAAIARLRDLAGRARRLPPPSARRPESFHEARDELGREMLDLAQDFERALGISHAKAVSR